LPKKQDNNECLYKGKPAQQVSSEQNKYVLTIEIGMMSWTTEGFATPIPPTALVTETAGVNIPSAMVKLVPNKHW
jgi:hypothetical protein